MRSPTIRRARLRIPAVHTCRTRTYLGLRDDCAGRWTVRIMSSNDFDLASYAFSVVE
jgi:hypothetical protein